MTANIRFYGFSTRQTAGLLLMDGPAADRAKVILCLERSGAIIDEVGPDVKDKLMTRFEGAGTDNEASEPAELPLENVDNCAVQK